MKETELICFSCKKRTHCKVYKQIMNFDDAVIQSAFDYDPDKQEIGVAIFSCKDYVLDKRIKKKDMNKNFIFSIRFENGCGIETVGKLGNIYKIVQKTLNSYGIEPPAEIEKELMNCEKEFIGKNGEKIKLGIFPYSEEEELEDELDELSSVRFILRGRDGKYEIIRINS